MFRDTNTSKIQDLNEKSQKLELLVERFTSRLRQRQTEGIPIEVQFFYETLKTKGVLVGVTPNYTYRHWLKPQVVPEASARLLGFESHASIHANHSDLCKYSESEDEGYKSVSSAILRLSEIQRKGKSSTTVSFIPFTFMIQLCLHQKAQTNNWNNYGHTKVSLQAGVVNVQGGQHFH